MNRIRTEIEIAATPERLWQTLSDLESYGQWNPDILRAQGRVFPGAEIQLEIRILPRYVRPQMVTLISVNPNYELRWRGHLWNKHVFQGEHSFQIEWLGRDRVRLVQQEIYTGVLAQLLLTFLQKRIRHSFELANQSLKKMVETTAPAESISDIDSIAATTSTIQ